MVVLVGAVDLQEVGHSVGPSVTGGVPSKGIVGCWPVLSLCFLAGEVNTRFDTCSRHFHPSDLGFELPNCELNKHFLFIS